MKIAPETSSGPVLHSTHEGHRSQIKLEEQKQGEKLPELARPIVTAWSLTANLVAFHQSQAYPISMPTVSVLFPQILCQVHLLLSYPVLVSNLSLVT